MPTTPVAPSAVPDFPALSDRTTYNAKAYAWAVHMDTVYPAEMQALATVTNSNAVEAAASAVTASGYVATVEASASAAAISVTQASGQAAIAQGAANNKGNWSALTGALNMPAAVVHSGKIWVLVANLANVTTSQPGVSANWLDISPATIFNGAAVLTSGTGWVCPSGVYKVRLRMAGAGGAGNAGWGNGGGAAGYLESFVSVSPGVSYAYTIGATGAGAGGASTFVANSITYTANGGGLAGASSGAGGSGGSATNGYLNITGAKGDSFNANNSSASGGDGLLGYGSGGTTYVTQRPGIIILEW